MIVKVVEPMDEGYHKITRKRDFKHSLHVNLNDVMVCTFSVDSEFKSQFR